MNIGGLIAGALKGVGEGYTAVAKGELENQQKLDYQKQYLDALEQKELRLAEAQDNLTRRGKIRDLQEVEPLAAEAAASRTKIVGGAETGVLASREDALRPGRVATKKAETLAQGEATRANDAAYAGDPTARAGVRAKAADSESPSAKVAASSTAASNNRAQEDWNRAAKAREAVANYHAAVDAGDEAGAKAARLEAIRLGVDPAASKRGSMKVVKDKDGVEYVVYEDSSGNVSRVDPNTLQPYTPKNAPKGAAPAENNDPLGLRTGRPAPSTAAKTTPPGRPLYDTPLSELQRLAARPRGVSSAEANEAQAELNARRGEPRMSAY